MRKSEYDSKWSLVGINKQDLKKLYNKNRIKAYLKLKHNHEEEYSNLLEGIMDEIYNKILKERLNKLKELEK